jgi:hypothetical protein
MGKKVLLAVILLTLSSVVLFAEFNVGLYMGGDQNRDFGDRRVTWGMDMQWGYGFNGSGLFSGGIYANTGLDSGQPNEPNLYFGGIGEFYYGVMDMLKIGFAFGMGWNTASFANAIHDRSTDGSFYLRMGVPLKMFDLFKFGFCYDIYFGQGSRLGFLISF